MKSLRTTKKANSPPGCLEEKILTCLGSLAPCENLMKAMDPLSPKVCIYLQGYIWQGSYDFKWQKPNSNHLAQKGESIGLHNCGKSRDAARSYQQLEPGTRPFDFAFFSASFNTWVSFSLIHDKQHGWNWVSFQTEKPHVHPSSSSKISEEGTVITVGVGSHMWP